MTRNILIAAGILVAVFHRLVYPIPQNIQLAFFFLGIITLGIPHGAADLLVAKKNADANGKRFSKVLFFAQYFGKIIAFGLLLWLLPSVGIFIFVLIAAYHFGETDFHQYKTETTAGKIFVVSYGLLILNIILLNNLTDVRSLLQFMLPENELTFIFNFLQSAKWPILGATFLLFCVCVSLYFSKQENGQYPPASFIIRLLAIVAILFSLPLILSFAFYFIIWHSTISLSNIVTFLKQDKTHSTKTIVSQIALFSFLALVGIALFGLSGYMLTNYNVLMMDIFLGLAVLTTPHMHIMHDMYGMLRNQSAKH